MVKSDIYSLRIHYKYISENILRIYLLLHAKALHIFNHMAAY